MGGTLSGKSKQGPPEQFPWKPSTQPVPGTARCPARWGGQRSYAKLTGSVYSRPALCLDILALLTASLTTDGSKTFIMLHRAALQTIAENCEKFNSLRAARHRARPARRPPWACAPLN